jgi:hypothetical protein
MQGVSDDASGGLHFAGLNSWLLARHLRELGDDALARVLREAGDPRTEAEMFDLATWSSYDQFRRLLEATARLFGAHELTRAASGGLADPTMPEMTSMLQSLGSPEALLAMLAQSGGAGLAPVVAFEAHEAGPAEWTVHEWFLPGFAPYRVYCSWATGLYANIPMLFGMRAEVTKEACACDGAPACVYRVRWFPDDTAAEAGYVDARIQMLTARLDALQATVGDLVSDDDLELVLARVIVAAKRTISAPVFVLALEGLPAADQHVYAAGIDDASAARLAGELLAHDHDEEDGYLVVEVESQRRRYGRLAAVNTAGRFFPQERVVLQAYGRLAAAALDSATAVEDARVQAQTARALLELSNSLADIGTDDEMAAHIARAVTAVVGCDRAAVILFESGAELGRVAATHGFPTDDENRLHAMEVPVAQIRSGDVGVNV